MKKELVAIYGGTFSPPHIGHIRAAEAFQRALDPDRLLIIPSAKPPHKAPVHGAADADRLAMCRLAFSSIPSTEISDLELLRKGRSYTVDTLLSLSSRERRLVMLVGTDMFLSLDTWRRAEEIFALTEIAFIRRESDPDMQTQLNRKRDEYTSRYGVCIHEITCDATVISSSELRRRIAAGISTEGYLTTEVEAYIQKWHLYQD